MFGLEQVNFKMSIRKIRPDVKPAADTAIWSLGEKPQLHSISTWLVFKDENSVKSPLYKRMDGLKVNPELCQHLETEPSWPRVWPHFYEYSMYILIILCVCVT